MSLLHSIPTVGLGAMELCFSTKRPPMADAIMMIESLITDHGLSYIDTADSYCINEEDFGYGDRLIKQFVGRKEVLIATKIGFKRTGGAWIKCGDPKYLRSACEQSLKNLGVETIEFCQFHTIDPDFPLEESLGEMARLRDEGKIQSIGVSNFYSVEELERAMAVTPIVSVQNPLSILFYKPETHDPILRYCEEHSMLFVAYAPFGGHRNAAALASDPELVGIAESAGLSIHQLALLFLQSLSTSIISIPGSIVKEHIIESLSTIPMSLPEEAIARVHEIIAAE